MRGRPGELEAWLVATSERYDVRISDPHSRVLQIQGPLSGAVMSSLADGATDRLGYFRAGHFDING